MGCRYYTEICNGFERQVRRLWRRQFKARGADLAMGTGKTIGYHPERFLLGRVSSIGNRDGNGG